jgi:hypothetical protein
MKYFLALILAGLVFLLSYIIMWPYLLMSFRFKAHFIATGEACGELLSWIDTH